MNFLIHAAKRAFKMVIAILISATVSSASSMTSASSCMTSALTRGISLHHFPYDNYLTRCNIANFRLLENDRRFLEDNGQDGDQFLFDLFSRHLLRHPPNPVSVDEVQGLINLVDGALGYSPDGNRRADVYRAVGYLLLDNLNLRTKEAISSKRLLKGSREARYVLKALSERGYIVVFPTSRWEKLRHHASAGNWSYISDRLWLEVVQRRSTLLATVLAVSAAVILARLVVQHRCRARE